LGSFNISVPFSSQLNFTAAMLNWHLFKMAMPVWILSHEGLWTD